MNNLEKNFNVPRTYYNFYLKLTSVQLKELKKIKTVITEDCSWHMLLYWPLSNCRQRNDSKNGPKSAGYSGTYSKCPNYAHSNCTLSQVYCMRLICWLTSESDL